MNGKRRVQFGLRKLLLWTAVVSLYCGLCKTAKMSLTEFIYLTAMVAAAGVLRAVTGIKLGCCLSMVCGVLWVEVWDSLIVPSSLRSPGFSVLDAAVVVLGLLSGGVIFILVCSASVVVNWADSLMRRRDPS
jgi:hypothetical protein